MRPAFHCSRTAAARVHRRGLSAVLVAGTMATITTPAGQGPRGVAAVAVNSGPTTQCFLALQQGVLFVYEDVEGSRKLMEAVQRLSCRPSLALPLSGAVVSLQTAAEKVRIQVDGLAVDLLPVGGPAVAEEWRRELGAAGDLVASRARAPGSNSFSVAGACLSTDTPAAHAAPARFPRIGDHVVAQHGPTGAFYMATVAAFNRDTCTYTVNWDDGDASGRSMGFDQVALDAPPAIGDISVGTVCM